MKDDQHQFNSIFNSLDAANDEGFTMQQDVNHFSKLIISIDSSWKGYFDIIMLFASVYNTFS